MEKLNLLPNSEHPLLPFTRFHRGACAICKSHSDDYIYGGYICNQLGCESLFHSLCVLETKHFFHPNHRLELFDPIKPCACYLCEGLLSDISFSCSICDFKSHLDCPIKPSSQPPPVQFKVHDDHPLQLSLQRDVRPRFKYDYTCQVCKSYLDCDKYVYLCIPCEFIFHVGCVEFFPEGYHISHSKHPLKYLASGQPDYSDTKCLLCGDEFKGKHIHHCDVCNFSICAKCVRNPPPIEVVSLTTHEHTLHLLPRMIDFTCNACGTRGDRSPYLCLQCNFMIHRECIDLPRVININRHDHRISYTSHLGHGNWTCGVCRKTMDGFYGGYSCSNCPTYVVHSRCATNYNIWDLLELEGTTEETEMEPFEVINDHTIKHFSHDHNLKINRDGKFLEESILCEACVFQICDDPFYSCEQCDFILHETCAHLRRKKRHVANNLPFTLEIDSPNERKDCFLCKRYFTGFKYNSVGRYIDVRCGSFLEPFLHKSHPHPLHYKFVCEDDDEDNFGPMLRCDECSFTLRFWWAFLPEKIMNNRYDDHPLFLSYGENNVSSIYWCDVCETKLDPKKWFYTCDDCGITLHVSCVVGDLSFHKPGSNYPSNTSDIVVIANTSICRPNCRRCDSRCIFAFVLKTLSYNIYVCSQRCY